MNYKFIYTNGEMFKDIIYTFDEIVAGVAEPEGFKCIARLPSSEFLDSKGEEIFEHDRITIITNSELLSVECKYGKFTRKINNRFVEISGFYFEGDSIPPHKINKFFEQYDSSCVVKVNNSTYWRKA